MILVGGLLALSYAADIRNLMEMQRKLGERRVLAQGAELNRAHGMGYALDVAAASAAAGWDSPSWVLA